MENLWWPGLTLLRPEMTKRLLDGVHYKHKGIMLDTGYYLHTDWDITSLEDGIRYLNEMLDTHKEFLPYFKGIHLQQSLTGKYVKSIIANPKYLTFEYITSTKDQLIDYLNRGTKYF